MIVHDTLSNKKIEFVPIDSKEIKMYVCGVTPYDECHLGHGRCYVVFDTIRRYFEYRGFKVKYVQNVTDIDDKIIKRSKEAGIKPKDLTEKYTKLYFDYCQKLNIKPASLYPRATEHIKDIISMIEKLIEKGYAYAVEGDVYFSVRKFESYGKLSKRSIDELLVGARIEPNEKKKDPLDFALWKKVKQDEPSWDSPWGNGRPGWHIECSVMSTKYLGETLDIHGGGQDLTFPHHENEIAQSESVTGKPFSKYWIHNGFVTINREKMSKSLGNFFTLKEIFEKYPPVVVRLFLLSQHYRTPVDFSDDKLKQSQNAWSGLVDVYELACFVLWKTADTLKDASTLTTGILDKSALRSRGPQDLGTTTTEKLLETITKFEKAMDDDFNTEKALSVIFDLKTLVYQKIHSRATTGSDKSDHYKMVEWLKQATNTLKLLTEEILGLKLPEPIYGKKLDENLINLLDKRESARKNKKWSEADQIRKEISEKGFLVEDTIYGPRLKRNQT